MVLLFVLWAHPPPQVPATLRPHSKTQGGGPSKKPRGRAFLEEGWFPRGGERAPGPSATGTVAPLVSCRLGMVCSDSGGADRSEERLVTSQFISILWFQGRVVPQVLACCGQSLPSCSLTKASKLGRKGAI